MNKILCVILSAVMLMPILTSCGDDRSDDTSETAAQTTVTEDNGVHTLYFKDGTKSSQVTATFFNSVSGDSEDVEMEKVGEDSDAYTFSCEGDCSAYNMVYVTCDGKATSAFAFNRCVSDWYYTEDCKADNKAMRILRNRC